MRRRKIFICILTLFFSLVVARLALSEYRSQPPFSFRLETAAGKESLHFWASDWGERFVFLPSFADLEKVVLESRKPRDFSGVTLGSGDHCQELELGKSYPVSGGAVTFLKSENLPALFLNTASGNLDYVHKERGNREGGQFRLYSQEGALLHQGGLTIQSRGNSTFLYQEKKPYGLTLSAPADLLGMGAAENWVLLANAFDNSHLRNKIVCDFAAQTELPYTPECQWVDLYLNGEYAGLYLLSEQNEIHPQRIAIPSSGSFLVTMETNGRENPDGIPNIGIQGDTALRIRSTDLPQEEMESIWDAIFRAFRSENGTDPLTGKHYTQLIDLDSWVRKFLIEEVFGNIDGGWYSQYFYRSGADPSGKVYAGPVWDYDQALGNASTYWEFGNVEHPEMLDRVFYIYENPDAPLYGLYHDPQFLRRMREIFHQEFLPLLETLPAQVADYASLISNSAQMNAIRWNAGDPAEESAALQRYIAGRREVLTQAWAEDSVLIPVQAHHAYRCVHYLLNPGDTLAQLPDTAGYQWYLSGTDQILDKNAPVHDPLAIELRPIAPEESPS